MIAAPDRHGQTSEGAAGRTIAEVLRTRAVTRPDAPAYTFLTDGETEAGTLTWGDLDRRARALAARLAEAGLRGERALLLFPPGLDFIAAFFGCLYAGAVAVPAYPPRLSREGQDRRLQAVAEDARPRAVLTTAALQGRMARSAAIEIPELAAALWLAVDEIPEGDAEVFQGLDPEPADLAFLQYTSGSTATPKGVKVTHANLVANQRMIQRAFRQTAESVVVGWLPLYHDMGLIGNVLQPLWSGGRCVLMAPAAFLQRPGRWLRAITRYRATTSGGPDFAYDLCVRRIGPAEREGLDLSSWEVAFDGAEPVRAATLERFAAAFAPCGFRFEAFRPCYGLAEATLLVSGERTAVGPVLARRVGCGAVVPELEVAIVDPEAGVRLEDGEGEIWVSGPSVAAGYWGKPEETRATFEAELEGKRWLRTGDLGFIGEGGELFVAGRIKDLLILRGRNLYPQDVERTAEASHPALRPGGAAAFAVEEEGAERLVLVLETEPRARLSETDVEAVAAAVRQAVAEEHEATVLEVALIPAGALPRTSSGKVRRGACREAFLTGALPVQGRHRLEERADPLSEIVSRLLGTDPSSLDRDLSLRSLGLDSLGVIELRSRLEEQGIELPLADLLEDTTLGSLAERLVEEGPLPIPPPLRGRGRHHPSAPDLPLSLNHNQQALWILHQRAPESTALTLALVARIVSGFDSEALAGALEDLIERHEALPAGVETPAYKGVAPPGRVATHAAGTAGILPAYEINCRLEAGVLRLEAPHIALDFGSLGVLLRDLGALYAARRQNRPAALPPVPHPASHFAAWQADLLGSPAGERLRAFWRQYLSGAAPAVAPPPDGLRQPGPVHPADTLPVAFSAAWTDRLRTAATRSGRTLYAELLAGLFALLARQSGETDLRIGSPASGRTTAAFLETVGYLMNPLPLRVDAAGDPPFAELAARTWRTVVAALEHQDYPSHLMTADAPPGPLFRVLLTFNRPRPEDAAAAALAAGDSTARVDLGGLVLEPVPVAIPETLFDVHLLLVETGGAFRGYLTAAADLYDRPTMARLLRQLEILLAAAAETPDRRLSDLPLLGEGELWQIVGEWNETGALGPTHCRDAWKGVSAAEIPEPEPLTVPRAGNPGRNVPSKVNGGSDRDPRPGDALPGVSTVEGAYAPVSIPEAFFLQAARTPNAVAVLSEHERLSYGDLAERAGRLAGLLRSRGAGPEVRVGLCAERTPDAVVGLLGILASGAAYVPVDPAYPPERIAWILADAGAAMVVSQRRLAGRLPDGLAAVFVEEEGGGALSREAAAPESLAYVLYTSGSTGQPKGVLISHGSLAAYVETAARSFGIAPGDRVLQFASLGFDTSAEEIFPCLTRGATLVLRTDAMVGSVPRFLEVCARWQVSVLDLPTAFWHELALHGGGLPLPPALRLVILGGERVSPEALQAWSRSSQSLPSFPSSPPPRLVNTYGPTEATIVATSCDLPDPGLRPGREVSIGRPIPGARALVLDPVTLQLQPPGVPGELALGGVGLARGYLGRPDTTAERFMPDPFGTVPGDRLYRTGDRVRQRSDGSLEFAGRLDRQVKVRGFRVEPGEIEAALGRHPDVREAAVVALRGEGGDARLAAWVVPAGESLDPAALRRHLMALLPPYMVPGSFTVLPVLPRTASGKLDRAALPAPGASEGEPAGVGVPPRTPTEAALAAIWAGCLEVDQVGVETDFFELGGHSLLVTRVISRVREELGVEIPLATFFETPTVADLALVVESAGRTDLPPIRRVPRDGREIPLSFAQERLWFLAQLDPASLVAYHVPRIVHVEGRLDVWALERAYEALIERHESLRTVFPTVDGRPVQEIQPPYPFRLPVVDLRGLPPERRRPELERLVATEVRSSFDLQHGPLLWATFIQLGDAESTLIQSEHHIVHDGWTQGVLLDDLLALYTGFHEGRPAVLPELPVQYADFAVWQRDWLQGEVLAEHLSYWRTKLAGMPPVLDLPADRPRPPVQTFRGSTQFFHLPPDLLGGLARLTRSEGATLFMVLLSAFEVLLHRYARRDDLVVATPIANRTHLEIEALIGFFVNTLLLRTDLSGRPTFRELIERVRATTLGAYAHQHLPFERLVEELAPERNLAYNPLCQVMFILQNARVPELRLPGLVLRHQEVHNRTAKFDLMLSLQERDGGLFGWAEYSTDLFDAATIQRLRGHFERLLAAVCEAPESRLLDLPWLAPEEEHQLLCEWSPGGVGEAGPEHPVEAFEIQAARQPDAPALVHDGLTLTYGELLERTRSLSARLRGLGVGPEVRVALCLEPGFDLVTGLLAVLDAGGAFLPLDPAHPDDRIGLVLEDSGARLLLTNERHAPRFANRPVFLLGEAWASTQEGGGALSREAGEGRGGGQLAYLLYTSGSTGRPKGVEIPCGALDNLLRSLRGHPGLSPSDVTLSATTVGFDVALVELFLPLCTGGRIVLADRDVAADGRRLAALLRESGATLLQGTPSLFSLLYDAGWEGDPHLQVWSAGEALPRALADRLASTCAGLWNLYGPTEATVYASGCRIHPEPGPVPIGGPVAGSDLQVLDPELRPSPAGVPGELFLGGPGVARGYLGRPALTAERFVPDPAGRTPGGRLYRTGDLARWRPDGRLEFLGRLDHQVKLRGYRIELGEIEAALVRHPAVSQSAVVLSPGPSGDPRLVAYVVPGSAGRPEGEPLDRWRQVWDQIYSGTAAQAGGDDFDLSGWISSYTGEPIGEAAMREWVDRTVERILALRPARVLEIGCGTGLLLHRVAPHCERYAGTDLSPAVAERLRRRLAADPALDHVEVRAAAADDPGVFPGESFDLIVLNSVVQYFPGLEYLERVLASAATRLRPGGAIFLGDVRSLPLLETFRADVLRHRAGDRFSAAELRRRVREQVEREKELVLDPRLFPALVGRLTGIATAEVQLKRGRHRNELTRFRYDVVLRSEPSCRDAPWGVSGSGKTVDLAETPDGARSVRMREPAEPLMPRHRDLRRGDAPRGVSTKKAPGSSVGGGPPVADVAASVPEEAAWDQIGSLATLREQIAAALAAGRALSVRHIPNGRIAPEGQDPEDLWELAEALGAEAILSWEDAEIDQMQVLFRLPGTGAGAPSPAQRGRVGEGALSLYANRPRLGDPDPFLIPDLAAFLRASLPAYMVPSAWVTLDALPLTPTGKVDRQALPSPEGDREPAASHLPPRTATEEALAAIWTEVLGVGGIGARDDFFALGGHSLIATRLTSRIERRFGVDLPLKALFESPTLAALAARIDRDRAAASRPAPPPLLAGPRPDPVPLSFAQQRLWFLDRLGAGAAYNLAAAVRLRGPLDRSLLERCLNQVVRRHEILRTSFPDSRSLPSLSSLSSFQQIAPELTVPLPLVDLPEESLPRAAADLLAAPFALDRLPLLRAACLRLGPEDHALVLVLHHIVADGWSQGVLVHELTALYRAGGDPGALPPLPVQYADFAVWQREWLSGEVLEAELAFWRQRLAGAPPVLDLPADRPRSAQAGFRGGQVRFRLPGPLARTLAHLAGESEATLFLVLLAAFQTLLGRMAGQDDVVVGSPVANRNRIETEGLIGFFVNTLPLRGDLSGDPRFADLLARVRDAALGDFAHQDLPFELLVEELRPERSLGHSPLFQAVLAFHNTPLAGAETPGLAWEPLPVESGQSPFDLTLSLAETAGGLEGSFTYRRDLFDRTTVLRLAGHLETLLAAVVEDPGRRLSALPLLTAAEGHQVTAEWGSATGPLPRGCLHEAFEDQARRRPDAVALVWEETRWTYAELDGRANRLARHLRRRGVGPERIVGLCLERSAELVLAILAVLKAGGAYLPLDPAQPAARRELLLAEAGACALLTAGDLDAEEESPDPLPPAATPDNLAYVLFTSGSTGIPKGCRVTHGQVTRLPAAFPDLGPDDVWTLSHSHVFDFSVWEIWGALARGGRLVLVPHGVILSPEAFAGLLEREGVTVLNLTPSAFRALSPRIRPGRLRWLGLGGEALPVPALEAWFERHGDRQPAVYNLYGPTEAAVFVTARRITAADVRSTHRSPLGRVLPDLRMQVVDAAGRPAPIGVPGELWVGGPGLSRGYAGRPDLTVERFVPDPAGEPGARAYRTGDRVRLTADGELDFLGRTDRQVKVRGVRVEPGEIEAALEAHPAVERAVVLLREDTPGQPRLVAYVTPPGPDAPELRRFLAERLPETLLPAAFVALDAWPLTPGGKLDRRALPAPESGPAGEIAAPGTPLEEILAGLFADALDVPAVDVHASFFELGGHSLLATALVAEIREVLAIELPLRTFFTAPSVASLAAAIEAEPAWRESAVRTAALLAGFIEDPS